MFDKIVNIAEKRSHLAEEHCTVLSEVCVSAPAPSLHEALVLGKVELAGPVVVEDVPEDV